MPDRRTHRGPHPEDARLFDSAQWPLLCQAVDDLCWLLSRGYPEQSAKRLVGDRYSLAARQRSAVDRCACADQQRDRRQARCVDPSVVAGRPVWLDGYNVLTTLEAALSGGLILPGRDGCYRDLASMHGSYRHVEETPAALEILGRHLAALGAAPCTWYFDRPVSNSGRLKTVMEAVAAAHGWPWIVELVPNPDPLLAASAEVIVTADSAVLDACRAWLNLARETIDRHVPTARVVPLGSPLSLREKARG